MCDSSQHDFLEYCMAYIDYSVSLSNTSNMLSPGLEVLCMLPPHLIWAQPCPFLYIVQPPTGLPLDLPLKCTLQDGVPFALSRVTTCSNNLNFLFLTISRGVSYFPMYSQTLLCMSTLHGRRSMRGIMHDMWRQCVERVSWAFLVTFLARS